MKAKERGLLKVKIRKRKIDGEMYINVDDADMILEVLMYRIDKFRRGMRHTIRKRR